MHRVEADGAGHFRQRRGRYGHPEQADRQRIKHLRVCETGHGAGRQQAGEHCVDVRADLHDSTAHEYRDEIAHGRPHVFVQLQAKAKMRHQLHHGRQLHEHLQRASCQSAECKKHRKLRQGRDVSPP